MGHNSRPGPVYAGGGYTPVNNVLDDEEELSALLRKFPDLVNDISTGGAQPLHMCGMSKGKQNAVKALVSHGADIEAIDTYGFTPLHRMASNNLSKGAKALLESGADPVNVGKIGQTPAQVAQSSNARDVIKVLQDWGKERKEVGIVKIVVDGAGFKELNQEYVATSADEIPTGFEWVAGRKVGTPQTHGGSSTGTQSGSKLQLKRTFTGTSLMACGGSMSQAETESTSPRRPRGLLHRLDGRPLDHLDRCQAWSPPSETFKSWHRRKSFIKIGPTPYLMAAIRNLYKVISRQLDLPLAFLCYSQNKWLPELLTAADT